jgi:hypothetical protein
MKIPKNLGFKIVVLGGLAYFIYKYGFTTFLILLTVLVTLGTLYSGKAEYGSSIMMCLLFLVTYLGIKRCRKNKWENYMKGIVGKEHFENNKAYYYELKNK